MLFFWTFFIKESWKILSSTAVFNTDHNKKCSRSRELHAAPPRGHYGECSLHDRCLKHVWNHANLLAHLAHDVIGRIPKSIKGHLPSTSSSLLSSGGVCLECSVLPCLSTQVSVSRSVCLRVLGFWHLRTRTTYALCACRAVSRQFDALGEIPISTPPPPHHPNPTLCNNSCC